MEPMTIARARGYMLVRTGDVNMTNEWGDWCRQRRMPCITAFEQKPWGGNQWGRLEIDLRPSGRLWTDDLLERGLKKLVGTGFSGRTSVDRSELLIDRVRAESLEMLCQWFRDLLIGAGDHVRA